MTTPSSQVKVPLEGLTATVSNLLASAGFSAAHAGTAADVLVRADLRGFETHGVSNMLRRYLGWVDDGHIDPRAELKELRRTPATASLDSQGGLGTAHAPYAMQQAIDMAQVTGLGMVTVIGGRHCGMASYHALMAAEAGMVGVCMTAGGPRMVPAGARDPRLGTNPIAVAAPLGELPPFSYDASTTVSSLNKIATARRRGLPAPAGLAADGQGEPVTVPSTEVDGSRLLPLGGTLEGASYKGSGLGAIVELLTAILGGSRPLTELGTGHNTHSFLAIRIDAFTDAKEYADAADAFGRSFLDMEAREGHTVRYPGWRAAHCEDERRSAGIPLDPEVVAWLSEEHLRRTQSPAPL
jgi:LDH2 family malate/lactate/ureidoglycolate dehydrogenase